jgi:hypothetical protein
VAETARTASGWAEERPILSTSAVVRIRPNARVPASARVFQVANGSSTASTRRLLAPSEPERPISFAIGSASTRTTAPRTIEHPMVGR